MLHVKAGQLSHAITHRSAGNPKVDINCLLVEGCETSEAYRSDCQTEKEGEPGVPGYTTTVVREEVIHTVPDFLSDIRERCLHLLDHPAGWRLEMAADVHPTVRQ